MATISGDVQVTGAINDREFMAVGRAEGDPDTGEYSVRLDYNCCPPNWHPFMYTDVKVSLLFLREKNGGKNFLSITGGSYRSAGTIDLGGGNVLRNQTQIELIDDSTLKAVYVMTGTAATGELDGMDYFEETMLPMGGGRIAALGLARWRKTGGGYIDGIFSTRYEFDEKRRLEAPQVRCIEATPRLDEPVCFNCSYTSSVEALPRLKDGGPFIGQAIAAE